jgi:hypothetical protein
MKSLIRGAAVAALLAATVGCATGSGGERRSQNPTRITPEEVEAARVANAYELIVELRPRWLVDRGVRSFGGAAPTMGVLVYQDQNLLGGIPTLRSIPLGLVRSVRYLDAATAAATMPGAGSGHVSGAIVVETRGTR